MKAFFSAVAAAFVIALVASFALETVQSSSDRANTTSGARVDFAKDGVNRRIAN